MGRDAGPKMGGALAANASDPYQLAAVTPWHGGSTAAWPSVRGSGLHCLYCSVASDHGPPITTRNPNNSANVKSANPITIGSLDVGCCLARGPQSTGRVTAYQSRIQSQWPPRTKMAAYPPNLRFRRACSASQRLIFGTNGRHSDEPHVAYQKLYRWVIPPRQHYKISFAVLWGLRAPPSD